MPEHELLTTDLWNFHNSIPGDSIFHMQPGRIFRGGKLETTQMLQVCGTWAEAVRDGYFQIEVFLLNYWD